MSLCSYVTPRATASGETGREFAPFWVKQGHLTAFERHDAEREAVAAISEIVKQAEKNPSLTHELSTLYIAARALAQLGRIEQALEVCDLLKPAIERGQVVDVRQHVLEFGVQRRTILGDDAGAQRLLNLMATSEQKGAALLFLARHELALGRHEIARKRLYAASNQPIFGSLEIADLLLRAGDRLGALRVVECYQRGLPAIESVFALPKPMTGNRVESFAWEALASRLVDLGVWSEVAALYRRSKFRLQPDTAEIVRRRDWVLLEEIIEGRRRAFTEIKNLTELARQFSQIALELKNAKQNSWANELLREARDLTVQTLSSPTNDRLGPFIALDVAHIMEQAGDESGAQIIEKLSFSLVKESPRESSWWQSKRHGIFRINSPTLWEARLKELQSLPAVELRERVWELRELVRSFLQTGQFSLARQSLALFETTQGTLDGQIEASEDNPGRLLFRALLWQVLGEHEKATEIISAVRQHHQKLQRPPACCWHWESLGRYGLMSPVTHLHELPSLNERASVMQAYVAGLTARFFQPLKLENTFL